MNSALLMDFYALTMSHGFWKNLMKGEVIFEVSFRCHPFNGGFSVFAGLETLLNNLQNWSFSEDDIAYLKRLGLFEQEFLDYLQNFRFNGSLWAMNEGTVIFPQEPLIRVQGNIIECQLIESMLLNIINFQSLIATKTARVFLASGKGAVIEFGLRRAQGPDGAMSASRAAFIGGAIGTSNTMASKVFGIPALGTMAHSWVMAYESEEEAFSTYADIYPDKTVFVIDTYDTLKSGVPNAIKIGKKLLEKGKNFGVRLDSGDIHYLAMQVRDMLNAAGCKKATITVSNELDEYIIEALTDKHAPIDMWGVGTRMVTGGGDSAFGGVYKLVARNDGAGGFSPVMKFSDNPEKTTTPGIKQVWRIKDASGMAVADVLGLEGMDILEKGKRYSFWHTSGDYRCFHHYLEGSATPLLTKRIENGKLIAPQMELTEIQRKTQAELDSFDASYKRLLNPHIYKVSIMENLRKLKLGLIKQFLGE
ncbi:MAG: nicotinate phosphoribosyltransferase [Treponema sp.]|jgi:nicotinate phosphoribosyltransferase|nr:nicotinate phosphoribosyltransferase [Treponema sp.]